MKKLILLSFVLFAGLQAQAKMATNLTKDFDSLGTDQEIVNRARALDPKNQVKVVQNRTVDRNNRVEFGVNGGVVAGGDPYLNTYNIGLSGDYHFNPKFSAGVRYIHSYNDLTADGKSMYDTAVANGKAGKDYTIEQFDYPIDTGLAVISWYPIYGKLNLFDSGIAQFDLYTLAGYGKVQLASGWTDTFTAGGGVGLWINNHWTTRLEVRWQGYQDQLYTGSRNLNLTVATLSIGFLL